MGLAGGLWGLYYARKLSLNDLIPSEEAIQFLREGVGTRAYYSLFIISCLIGVTVLQLNTESVESYMLIGERSGQIAGLVKPRVWHGEWWRILTSATLHGFFPLHLYFNGQALYGFGTLIEQLSNRAHLPIVFMLSVIGGGLFSLFFMPNITSIGASGGIMGLIGYMAIFGYKRRRQLPSDFLRSMLVNIGFIAAFGLIAYQFIDNFAHLGGLVTGAIYGLVQVPSDPNSDPRRTNGAIRILGLISLFAFLLVCIFTAFKLTGRSMPF
jgi:rhomboid protease GluP